MFSLNDIRRIMDEQTVGSLVVAGDLGTTNIATVTLSTSLSEALTFFTRENADELPVVEDVEASARRTGRPTQRVKRPRGIVGSKRVVALLTRGDLIAVYRKRLLEIQSADAQESSGSNVFSAARESTAEADLSFTDPASPKSSGPIRDAANLDKGMLDEPFEERRGPGPQERSD
jgi:CBS domain-containing protein